MTRCAAPAIRHLVIVGVGLIGGSFSLALQRACAIERITGVGRSPDNLRVAQARGIVHDWTHDVTEAVSDADFVLLATPVGSADAMLATIAPHLPEDAILSDVGSTKQSVIEAARRHLPDLTRFVPAHPLAGTEHSGAGAAFSELFQERWCLMTPLAGITDVGALDRVRAWWEAVGARVMCMDAEEHDELLAAVSHLPHVAAYAVVNCVSTLEKGGHDPFQFAAGGFRDFTRIASSSPEMWRDIALCNRRALLRKIDALQEALGEMRDALAHEDAEALLRLFSSARDARERWLDRYGMRGER